MSDQKVILIVDDDADIRDAVADALIDEGYRVVACADGASALEHLRRGPAPGLILLDWNMTPMNGLQFMESFAQEPKWASIPVALLTADAHIEEKFRRASFVGYLRKPMKLPGLLGLVEAHCTGP